MLDRLFSPFRQLVSRLPGLAKRVAPSVAKAVSVAVASSPSKVDDWAWARFLELYPTLAAHRTELAKSERDMVIRAVAEILAAREMPGEDKAAIRAAIELALGSGSRPQQAK